MGTFCTFGGISVLREWLVVWTPDLTVEGAFLVVEELFLALEELFLVFEEFFLVLEETLLVIEEVFVVLGGSLVVSFGTDLLDDRLLVVGGFVVVEILFPLAGLEVDNTPGETDLLRLTLSVLITFVTVAVFFELLDCLEGDELFTLELLWMLVAEIFGDDVFDDILTGLFDDALLEECREDGFLEVGVVDRDVFLDAVDFMGFLLLAMALLAERLPNFAPTGLYILVGWPC